MRIVSVLIAAVALVSAVPVTAQTIDNTVIPAPKKPNFASMRFLVGTWSCTSKSGRRSEPTRSTVTYALDDTGYWLVGKTEAKATSWNPRDSSSTDMITYDADAKRWVDVSTDNFGGYDLSTAKGWVGPRFVWHDAAFVPANGIVSATDLTMTRVSSTKLTFSSSFMTAKGRSYGLTGSCSKQS